MYSLLGKARNSTPGRFKKNLPAKRKAVEYAGYEKKRRKPIVWKASDEKTTTLLKIAQKLKKELGTEASATGEKGEHKQRTGLNVKEKILKINNYTARANKESEVKSGAGRNIKLNKNTDGTKSSIFSKTIRTKPILDSTALKIGSGSTTHQMKAKTIQSTPASKSRSQYGSVKRKPQTAWSGNSETPSRLRLDLKYNTCLPIKCCASSSRNAKRLVKDTVNTVTTKTCRDEKGGLVPKINVGLSKVLKEQLLGSQTKSLAKRGNLVKKLVAT